jgi:hypothetical protein
MEEKYIVTPEGGMTVGTCPLCWQYTATQIYELTTRQPRYTRRSGGGERERARRR